MEDKLVSTAAMYLNSNVVSSTDNYSGVLFNATAQPTPFRYSWTEFMSELNPVALSIDRCITPIWYIIGITANTISARIWTQRRMRKNNSSAVYLATLSLTDLVFLLLHIFQELKYAWDLDALSFPGICEGYFMIYITTQYLSPLLVLGFTVERWIAVCHPFQKEKYCTTRRATKVVAGFLILCILIGAMQGYLWMYTEGDCITRPETTIGGNQSFWSIWTWSTEMLMFLIVPLLMLLFNVLVICEVKRLSANQCNMLPGGQTNSTGAATTVMLLSVSFYVIITTLPATLVYALQSAYSEGDYSLTDEEIRNDPTWTSFFTYIIYRKVVEEICLSHYACNFFLYLLTGEQFRIALVHLCKCNRDRIKVNGFYTEVPRRTDSTRV